MVISMGVEANVPNPDPMSQNSEALLQVTIDGEASITSGTGGTYSSS
jgi:hypothetical protein